MQYLHITYKNVSELNRSSKQQDDQQFLLNRPLPSTLHRQNYRLYASAEPAPTAIHCSDLSVH